MTVGRPKWDEIKTEWINHDAIGSESKGGPGPDFTGSLGCVCSHRCPKLRAGAAVVLNGKPRAMFAGGVGKSYDGEAAYRISRIGACDGTSHD